MKRQIEIVNTTGAVNLTLTPLAGETIRVLSATFNVATPGLGDTIACSMVRSNQTLFAAQTGPAGLGAAVACFFIGAQPQSLHLVSTVVATGVAVYEANAGTINGCLPNTAFPFTFSLVCNAAGASIALGTGQVTIERTLAPQRHELQ